MKDIESPSAKRSPALLVCLLMVAILVALFWRSFLPGYVGFSNDGPMGMQASAMLKPPQAFFGQWTDLYSVGWASGASVVDFDSLLRWIAGPIGYAA